MEYEVLGDSKKYKTGILIHVLFWGFFIFMTLRPLSTTLLYRMISIGGILYCLLKVAVLYEALGAKRTLIRMNQKGLMNATSSLGIHEIPWDKIEKVKIKKRGNLAKVCLYGQEMKSLLTGKSFFERFVIAFRKNIGLGWAQISCAYTEAEVEEVYSRIAYFTGL